MIAKNRARLVGLFIASDILAIILSYLWSYLFRFNTITYLFPVDPAKGVPAFGSYLLVLPLFIAHAHGRFSIFQGFYKSRLRRTKLDDFFFISLNAILTILVDMAILNYVIGYSRGGRPSAFGFRIERPSLFFLILYFVGVIFAISILRNQIYFIMKRRYARGINLQNVLVVGSRRDGRFVAQKLYQYKDLGFVVKGFLADERKAGDMIRIDGEFVPVLGGIDDIAQVIEDHNVQEIYVALDLDNYPKILETIQIVNKYPVNVRLIPDLFQLLTLKANIQDLDGFPVISIDDVPLRGVRRIVKRMADFVISGLGLLFLSPFS